MSNAKQGQCDGTPVAATLTRQISESLTRVHRDRSGLSAENKCFADVGTDRLAGCQFTEQSTMEISGKTIIRAVRPRY